MEFTGPARPLTRAGMDAALARLQLAPQDAAYLWTMIQVETSGFGFRGDRRPQVRFERHWFRKFTKGRYDAEAPDVSGPADPDAPVAGQYAKLEKALGLCARDGLGPEPALWSTSWGIGQVMGFNHKAAGFATVQEMVQACVAGEDAQLAAMAGYIADCGLDAKLRAHDWAGVAMGYNGASYKVNRYDEKLATCYDRLRDGPLPDLDVRQAQAALRYLGLYTDTVDGVVGPNTRRAITAFRAGAGLPPGDALDEATRAALLQRAGLVS